MISLKGILPVTSPFLAEAPVVSILAVCVTCFTSVGRNVVIILEVFSAAVVAKQRAYVSPPLFFT